jgi:hypothetical protein
MLKKCAGAVLAAAIIISIAWPAGSETARPSGYVLNMYHFNIQYVVGSEASMRRIVKQSFEPLVDFYLAHPGWGADFEMQGVMIEYMGENYPEVLEKFKRLVNSGQAELVTFHYADQLLLAFPGHDQQWSLRLNEQLLKKYGVKRSGVIFTQEAQYGEGLSFLGRQHGYDVAVMTTSQYQWFQDDERFPFFTVHGMDLVTNRPATEPQSGIKVKWTFCGDGELVATGGLSPYFPGLFRKNPVKLASLAKKFQTLEQAGNKIATVTQYVKALRAAGVKPAELKPILDSPWRPEDGSGVLQWMGRYSLPWEKDYDLRTKNWQVRSVLVEAERAGTAPGMLERAWAAMLNAEVSDPSGWYPFPVEVKFDYQMMDRALAAIKGDPNINLTVLQKIARRGAACGPEVKAPMELRLSGQAAKAEARWSLLTDAPGGYCLEVSWSGKGDGGVAFPWAGNTVEYSPAMMEHTVRAIPVSALKGKTIHLGLPNGLIGLGNQTYLVRDNQVGCVAGGVDFTKREIRFEVQKGRENDYRFRFYLLQNLSADQALGFANNKVNRVEPYTDLRSNHLGEGHDQLDDPDD